MHFSFSSVAIVCALASAASAFSTLPSQPNSSRPFVRSTLVAGGVSPRIIGDGCLASTSSSDTEGKTETVPVDVPSFVSSPVLRKVYPALVSHRAEYGHPNIPLGQASGKMCYTLRRLHFQNKLSAEEVQLLEGMEFRFNSFEDVYEELDFDEMVVKLLEYERVNKTGFQIPKKYPNDPELGAWVTMLRRLREAESLPEEDIAKMDEIGFAWISSRKCGSAYMSKYREVKATLEKIAASEWGDEPGAVRAALTAEEWKDMKKWIEAQKIVHENGKLSASRVQYMDELPGVDWMGPL